MASFAESTKPMASFAESTKMMASFAESIKTIASFAESTILDEHNCLINLNTLAYTK